MRNLSGLIIKGELTPVAKVMVIILTLWALALIVPDYYRVFADYGNVGFVANNDGLITDVDNPIAATPPFLKGTYIDLHRTKLSDLIYIFAGMGGTESAPVGKTLTILTVDTTAGRTVIVRHSVTAASEHLDIETRIALFADQTGGIFFIVLATVLVWKRPSQMTLGFFLYALWYNPGQVFVFYAWLAKWPYPLIAQDLLQGVAQIAGLLGFVTFALRFPSDRVQGWRQTLERALPIIGLPLLVLQLWSFGTIIGMHTELIVRWAYLSEYILDLCVIVTLLASQRHQHPVERQRTKWVIWGCIIGLPCFILADINETTSLMANIWNPSDALIYSLYMVNSVVPISTAYAVMRHHVLDIRVVVRRAVARSFTWMLIGVMLIGFIIFLEDAIRNHVKIPAVIYIIVVSISLVFEWFHDKINERVDELLFRELYHASERLNRVGHAMANAANYDVIDRLLIDEPVAALQLASAAVFRKDSDGIYRQHVASHGWAHSSECLIEPTDTIVPEVTSSRRALRLSSVSWSNPYMPHGSHQPIIAIPIRCHNSLTAIAFYGLHDRGDDLELREIESLDKLCLAASAAYDQQEHNLLLQQLRELQEQIAARPRRRSSPAPNPA